MLENKKLNMVISLLIAIALWAFVIGEVNPEATRVYREVPIKYLNQEILESQNMAVYSVSDRTINVTLTGNRSEINKIETKEILATVDLSDAAMGDNYLRVDLKVPSKVEIESQSINKVTVNVERRTGKEVPVEVSYDGTFNGEEEPITVDQSLASVIVYGAESTVEKVVAAKAVVAENMVTADPQELEAALMAVNSAGQRIYNVSLSREKITITTELAKLKTVALYVPVEGTDSGGIQRTVTTPETITIKGQAADLDIIETIETEPVSVEEVVANTVIPLTPILPEGVELSLENGNLEAVVQVTTPGTKEMTFDQTKVEIQGLADGYSAQVADTDIDATLTGSESLLSNLAAADVTLTVDVSGMHAGRYKVPIQVQCRETGVAIDITPKKISVTIKADQSDGETEQTDDDKQNENNHESEE